MHFYCMGCQMTEVRHPWEGRGRDPDVHLVISFNASALQKPSLKASHLEPSPYVSVSTGCPGLLSIRDFHSAVIGTAVTYR